MSPKKKISSIFSFSIHLHLSQHYASICKILYTKKCFMVCFMVFTDIDMTSCCKPVGKEVIL